MKTQRVIAILLIVVMAFTITACGKVATVSINDDGMKTELEAKLPATVGKILEQAGITLGASDVATPAVTEKLSEAGEIVIDRMHTVKLTADGKTQSLEIVGGTVEDLLKAASVTLKEKQITNFELTEPLKEGMEVQVLDQMTVSITCDGETKTQVVNSSLIADVIKEFGITLGEDDEVTPAADQKATDGIEIVIDRVKYEEVKETVAVDYEIEYQYDANTNKGVEYTTVAGEPGEMEITYKVKYVNGEETETEVAEEKMIKEPVTAVVVIGTKQIYPVEVGRRNFPDCDGSGHGYYEVDYQYEDGHVETKIVEY